MKAILWATALTLSSSAIASAQMTADYVCWLDFGSGPVNMSELCGQSPTSQPALVTPTTSEIAQPDGIAFQTMPRNVIPGINSCAARLGDVIVADPNQTYESGTFEILIAQCASSEVQVASIIPSPSGGLEVVTARSDGSVWVRLPGEPKEYGYGRFASQQEARQWATALVSQF